MIAYHVVTERPMYAGQLLRFDQNQHSGVYERVIAKTDEVRRILSDPTAFQDIHLEHHTAVALRELAMEEVRQENHPQFPSRLHCLYVSQTLEEAERWCAFFIRIGRPTFSIVKLEINGRTFIADAAKCFEGTADWSKNKLLAEQYWQNPQEPSHQNEVREVLADGEILVVEILRVINQNLDSV